MRVLTISLILLGICTSHNLLAAKDCTSALLNNNDIVEIISFNKADASGRAAYITLKNPNCKIYNKPSYPNFTIVHTTAGLDIKIYSKDKCWVCEKKETEGHRAKCSMGDRVAGDMLSRCIK